MGRLRLFDIRKHLVSDMASIPFFGTVNPDRRITCT